MNFIKQHCKNLKKLTKKELIQQVINHIELQTQVENQFNESYEELFQESLQYKTELEHAAEIISDYVHKKEKDDNMSVGEFIRKKFK